MIILKSESPFEELPMFFLMLGIITAISYVAVYFKDWIKPQNNKDKINTRIKNEINSKDKSTAFVKEQTHNGGISSIANNPNRDTLKSMIRERMIGIVKETYENSPMKDTPFEGLTIQNAIASTNKNYKESFVKQKHKLGMTEYEINNIVDEVTKELLDRFLE